MLQGRNPTPMTSAKAAIMRTGRADIKAIKGTVISRYTRLFK
jgi:hypothetical protein